MAEFQVVTLAPEEWPLFKQIRLDSLLRIPQAYASNYAEVLHRPDAHWRERLIDAQAGQKSWLLFAKETDQVIGMIGAYRSAEDDAVEIISVYVVEEKRQQGVATALMAAILEKVAQAGIFRKAVLTVNADQGAAVALYRHFGFQIVAEKTGIMGDGMIHQGYLMEKAINGLI